jgi:uncharacterized protein DUF5304
MNDDADPDAWADACAEDLAAERRRHESRYGAPPLDAGAELRRLADAVVRTAGALGRPLAGPAGEAAARGAAEQLTARARAVVQPALERHPDVLEHLSAAGGELLAAFRSATGPRPAPKPEQQDKRTDLG